MDSENITKLHQTAKQFCAAYMQVQKDGLIGLTTYLAALDSRSQRQEEKLTALKESVDKLMSFVPRVDEVLTAWQIPDIDQKLMPCPVAIGSKTPIEYIREEMCLSTPDETYRYIMNMDERTLDMVLASSGMAVVPKKHKKRKARKVTIEAKRMQILRELDMDYLYPPKPGTEPAAMQGPAERPILAGNPEGNDADVDRPLAPTEDDEYGGHRRTEHGDTGDLKDKDVEDVMSQANISRDQAVQALRGTDEDFVKTLLGLNQS